jgi:hypothetical protein
MDCAAASGATVDLAIAVGDVEACSCAALSTAAVDLAANVGCDATCICAAVFGTTELRGIKAGWVEG